MITKASSFDYESTLRRLAEALERHGRTLFCRVDQAAGAREAGPELASEDVLFSAVRELARADAK